MDAVTVPSGGSPRRYTVRCWCSESGAEGEYTFKAPASVDAIDKAAEAFREDCITATAMYVPPRHRIQTEVIGVSADA